jgi:hypothetical protein
LARFLEDAVFRNAEFTAITTFTSARFAVRVPDFRGAKMHEATEWHGVTWPPPPQHESLAPDQVYAYERLKQEMERLKKHEDEQFFFRQELRAKRGMMEPWSGEWILNVLYGAVSDYGHSIGKPLFGLYLLFASGIFVLWSIPVFKESGMNFFSVASLGFVNVFSFLPARRDVLTDEVVRNLSAAAHVVGALQSVLGLVLLFLLGLALRNRFRMR